MAETGEERKGLGLGQTPGADQKLCQRRGVGIANLQRLLSVGQNMRKFQQEPDRLGQNRRTEFVDDDVKFPDTSDRICTGANGMKWFCKLVNAMNKENKCLLSPKKFSEQIP